MDKWLEMSTKIKIIFFIEGVDPEAMIKGTLMPHFGFIFQQGEILIINVFLSHKVGCLISKDLIIFRNPDGPSSMDNNLHLQRNS